MPGGYGIGAKGIGWCSEMSSSRHLMSQLFIKVPRGHVTIRLGTTSRGAVCFPRMPFVFDTFCCCRFIPCTFLSTSRFFLQVLVSSHCLVLVLWTLLYRPPFLFQTWHNFSLKPQHLNKTNASRAFHPWCEDDLALVQPLSFTSSLPPSGGLQSSRPTRAGALLAGLTLKGWCLSPSSSEDIH